MPTPAPLNPTLPPPFAPSMPVPPAPPSPVPPRLAWPTMTQLLPPGRHGSPREVIKHALRMLVAIPYRGDFLQALGRTPPWATLFSRQPRCFFPPLSHFLDRRWGMGHRFASCSTDLGVAARHFPRAAALAIALGQDHELLRQPGFSIHLGPNRVNLQEGYWALSLHAAEDGQPSKRLYNLSFGFTADRAVLIASLQGTAGQAQEDGGQLAAIQALTKSAHGLRPHHLLLAVFQLLCARWGVDELVGIAPQHHIKGRWNQRRSRLKFDYAATWQDAGGELQADGNWRLPALPRRRPDEDIPSRKRSQYRRRYQLLDELDGQLKGSLQGRLKGA